MQHPHMPHMYFQATMESTLWLRSWQTSSSLSFALTLVGLFVLCLLQEALHSYRGDHARRATAEFEAGDGLNPRRLHVRARVQSSLLYALNVALAYLLMLAVMTYNVSYFVVIVVGLAVGHFSFFRDPGTGAAAAATSDACCARSGL